MSQSAASTVGGPHPEVMEPIKLRLRLEKKVTFSSSPLSPISTPDQSPAKQSNIPKKITISLRGLKSLPRLSPDEIVETVPTPPTTRSSRKRRNTSSAEPVAQDEDDTQSPPKKRSRASTAQPTTRGKKKSQLTPSESLSPVPAPKWVFSEHAIVSFALREIYNSIPDKLTAEEVKLRWVSIEKRREVFELVERLTNYWAETQGRNYVHEISALKLDLHLWDEDVANICKVRYPLFESVMTKLLFWIERGHGYQSEAESVIAFEQAKAAAGLKTVSRNDRDIELLAILSDLKALEKQKSQEATHHRLRAGIFDLANRFCAEQSKVAVDCSEILEHLKADLHLRPEDAPSTKSRKLAALSKSAILTISSNVSAWIRGGQVYSAGPRASEIYKTWYDDYSGVIEQMVKVGLLTRRKI